MIGGKVKMNNDQLSKLKSSTPRTRLTEDVSYDRILNESKDSTATEASKADSVDSQEESND